MNKDDYRNRMAELSAEEMEAYDRELWNSPSMDIPDSDVKEALDSFRMRIGRTRRKVIAKAFAIAAAVAVVFLGVGLYSGARIGAEAADAVRWCEVFIDNGCSRTVTLPDGSSVIVGGGSRIMYPERFFGKERNVYFSGEGLFDVSDDAGKPFIVNVNGTTIKVTGTRFNVKAYNEDYRQTVTLMEGKVDVTFVGSTSPLHLVPGKAAFLDVSTGEIGLYDLAESHYPAWYKGEFDAYHSTFRQVARDLERIFDVRIIFRNEELENTTFYISIVRAESVDMILESLRNIYPFDIRREGKTIYLE